MSMVNLAATADVDVQEPAEDVYERLEANVRSYCRSFPASFTRAKGATIWDADGNSYVDFLAGAGALNYGHNHETIKRAVVDYILQDGIGQGLDLHTSAKAGFLGTLERRILQPRGLSYKVQFTGPTGTNAVEAAFKLARKATQRTGIFAFSGSYHGHSLGSLAATANREHRAAAGVSLNDVTFMPFPFGSRASFDTLAYLETVLADGHSGVEVPAAVIVETVQGEGGVCLAPTPWLQGLRRICDNYGIVLIVDDIQAGCGRTGPFFSFERAGIVPDMVTVSKSIGGLGLPMSLVLLKPELDVWEPAEHTGTFRGNQLAFVAAEAALEVFAAERLEERTRANGEHVADRLMREVCALDPKIEMRGIGMIWGIDLARLDPTGAVAKAVSKQCFADGLIIERVGRNDTVLKLLPPLVIERDTLDRGIDILTNAIAGVLTSNRFGAGRDR